MKHLNIIISTFAFITLIHSSMATADNVNKNEAIQKLLVAEANRQSVDPALALAMAKVESNFNAQALSPAGAIGIMQIMPATAEGVFGVSAAQLFDEKINIELGIRFIKQLLARYNQRTDIALSHYNGGSAVEDKFGRLTVIPATQSYVDQVLSAREQFEYRAVQLSEHAKKTSLNEHVFKLASANIPEQTYDRTKDQPKAKNIIKPDQETPSSTFDKSLYEKVDQLRTLRLHNIMRNTKIAVSGSNPPDTNRKLTRVKMPPQTKQELPLSDKRAKVLNWEKMFN